MVAQSQIGFIDFIVEPTFTVLTEMIERIVTPLIEEASCSELAGFRRSSVNSISCSDGKHSSVKSTYSEGSCSLTMVDFKSFKVTWNQEIRHNKETWKAQTAKGIFLEKNAKEMAEEDGQEENEAEENRTVERPETGQEEMKTDVKGQKEMENGRQQEEQQPKEEEGDNNVGAASSLLGSDPTCSDKKVDSHYEAQEQKCQNESQLIHHYKRPSYCASSYLVRSKVNEMRPIDARGKARRLQRISLRRGK